MSETVAIHHPNDPTRPTVIRRDRYNPKVHTIWGEGQDIDEDASPAAGEERSDEEAGPDAGAEVAEPLED